MARVKQPVSIWGIEFDALIDESRSYKSTIPTYPVEEGFPVSDTIINDPPGLELTLYITNTPVTWLYRHGTSNDRVNRICEQIESEWEKKQLTKIVTTDTIYTDMGITSISIRKSADIGYAREISINAQKVRITAKKTVDIPDYAMKSGQTEADAGKASTSKTPAKSSGSGSSGGTKKTEPAPTPKASSIDSHDTDTWEGGGGAGGGAGKNSSIAYKMLFGSAAGSKWS